MDQQVQLDHKDQRVIQRSGSDGEPGAKGEKGDVGPRGGHRVEGPLKVILGIPVQWVQWERPALRETLAVRVQWEQPGKKESRVNRLNHHPTSQLSQS